MDLSQEILNAETRFLAKLRDYFLFVFPEDKLDSHGLGHHQRVWSYVKELMLYGGTDPLTHNDFFAGKMIIAAYMHDIGMSIDTGARHGLHSRKLCEKFLVENDLPSSAYTDLLEAVEKHDNKEYLSSQAGNPVLQVLSVADDLDALGYIGIYRYLEIYLMRGVRLEVIGDLIINNVTGRFNNLEKIFGDQPGFMARHKPRFETIKEFFTRYSSQASVYQFGNGKPSGWCGVAELIEESAVKGISLRNLIDYVNVNNNDIIIKQYFTNLQQELTI